jgi:hypothetical protein
LSALLFIGTQLKNVLWPNIFVGASFKILDIQQYASGLRPTKIVESDGESSNAGKLSPAAILNQNPIFEMDSIKSLCKNRAKAINTGPDLKL